LSGASKQPAAQRGGNVDAPCWADASAMCATAFNCRGLSVKNMLPAGMAICRRKSPTRFGADGERGVAQVLEILRTELDLAMALCGCRLWMTSGATW